MPMGRPTKYDPAYCETVIAVGERGGSLTEMAQEIGVVRETLGDWRARHPDFSAAVNAGIQACQAWWERKGREATFGGCDGFNATAWIFNMKNRFRDDWRDKHEFEHQGGIAVTLAPEDEDI